MKVSMNDLISRKPLDAGANLCIQATSHVLQGASMVAGAVALAHLSQAAECEVNWATCVEVYRGTHSVTDWTQETGYPLASQFAGATLALVAAKVLNSAAKFVATWEVGKKVETLVKEQ
jgi:hypothetical protein